MVCFNKADNNLNNTPVQVDCSAIKYIKWSLLLLIVIYYSVTQSLLAFN